MQIGAVHSFSRFNSIPLSLGSKAIEGTRTCDAITEFKNLNTPKHKKNRKTSMGSTLKKVKPHEGSDCTKN